VSIATSLAMKAAGGMMDAVVTTGRTSFRVFTSSQSKQTILVATTTYSDARVINCKSTVQVPTASAELENLAQSMKLESGFLQVDGAVTTGRWKRPGNVPPVFVTMLSNASATVLSMERIDIPASATEKK